MQRRARKRLILRQISRTWVTVVRCVSFAPCQKATEGSAPAGACASYPSCVAVYPRDSRSDRPIFARPTRASLGRLFRFPGYDNSWKLYDFLRRVTVLTQSGFER